MSPVGLREVAVPVDLQRIERLIGVLVAATAGDYSVRIPLEEVEDPFLEVEVGINYLLEELAGRQQQNDAQHAQILANAREFAAQQEELVAALSTPIIALWPGVLALPIVGRIDDARTAVISARLLERIALDRATHVIVDLTGVAVLTSTSMSALLRVLRSIRLLGTSCLLTGIRPEVARQLVEFRVGDVGTRTLAHMSDALALVLAEKGALR